MPSCASSKPDRNDAPTESARLHVSIGSGTQKKKLPAGFNLREAF